MHSRSVSGALTDIRRQSQKRVDEGSELDRRIHLERQVTILVTMSIIRSITRANLRY